MPQQLVDDLVKKVPSDCGVSPRQDAGRGASKRLQQEPSGRAGAERVVDREDASGAEDQGYCAVHAWSQSARAEAVNEPHGHAKRAVARRELKL